MEIKKFMNLYKQNSPREFFDWLSNGRVIEVRFLSDYRGAKFSNWTLIKTLAKILNLEYRYNSLYIRTYDSLKKILLYRVNKLPLTRIYNIFVSVNPKRKVNVLAKNGLVTKMYYGGIAGTSHIQTILCDIEHIGERKTSATEIMLDECIQGAKYLCTLLELQNYWINLSANGVHLWFQLDKAIELPLPSWREITIKGQQKIKYNIKEEPINTYRKTYNRFIENLNRELKKYNPKLKVDEGAKDLSRIARPPGSWNVKVGKTQRAVGTVDKLLNNIKYNYNNFMAAKPVLSSSGQQYKEIKIKSKLHRYNSSNIAECPLSLLLTSRLLPSTLSRNHYLEQSFALLLRDNDIKLEEIPELINKMDAAQQKTVQVDPDYLEEGGNFNAETVNSYCYGCRLPFIYPIMEDTPTVKIDYITEEHYENLNSYSWKTVSEMSCSDDLKLPKSYYELKLIVRKLVNKYERSLVFFTLKQLLKAEWDYYHKNKIILSILNKTRRKQK